MSNFKEGKWKEGRLASRIQVKIAMRGKHSGVVIGTVETVTLSPSLWKKKMTARWERGGRLAQKALANREAAAPPFEVAILCPSEGPAGGKVPLSAARIRLDKDLVTRRRMVKLARGLLSEASLLKLPLDPALPSMLTATIHGEPLFEYGIGELFTLYGRFQERYGDKPTWKTMLSFIEGDHECHDHLHRGKTERLPLPYAIRHQLAHPGAAKNPVRYEDIRKAVILLRKWLAKGFVLPGDKITPDN